MVVVGRREGRVWLLRRRFFIWGGGKQHVIGHASIGAFLWVAGKVCHPHQARVFDRQLSSG